MHHHFCCICWSALLTFQTGVSHKLSLVCARGLGSTALWREARCWAVAVQERNKALRQAIGTMLAGSAADIAKAALLRIQEAIADSCSNPHLSHIHPYTSSSCSSRPDHDSRHEVVGMWQRGMVVQIPAYAVDGIVDAISNHLRRGLGFKAGGQCLLRAYLQMGQTLDPMLCRQVQLACNVGKEA